MFTTPLKYMVNSLQISLPRIQRISPKGFKLQVEWVQKSKAVPPGALTWCLPSTCPVSCPRTAANSSSSPMSLSKPLYTTTLPCASNRIPVVKHWTTLEAGACRSVDKAIVRQSWLLTRERAGTWSLKSLGSKGCTNVRKYLWSSKVKSTSCSCVRQFQR